MKTALIFVCTLFVFSTLSQAQDSSSSSGGTTVNGGLTGDAAKQLGVNEQNKACRDEITQAKKDVAAANAVCAQYYKNGSAASADLNSCYEQFSVCDIPKDDSKAKDPLGDVTEDTKDTPAALTACQKMDAQSKAETLQDKDEKLQDRLEKANSAVADIEEKIAQAQEDEAKAETDLKKQASDAQAAAAKALNDASKLNIKADSDLSRQMTKAQGSLNTIKQDATNYATVGTITAEQNYAKALRAIKTQCQQVVDTSLNPKNGGELNFVNINSLSQAVAAGGSVNACAKMRRDAVYKQRDAEEQKQMDLQKITNQLKADQDQMTTIMQGIQDDMKDAASTKQMNVKDAATEIQNSKTAMQQATQQMQRQQQNFQQKMQALQTQLQQKQLASKDAYSLLDANKKALADLGDNVDASKTPDRAEKKFETDGDTVQKGVEAQCIIDPTKDCLPQDASANSCPGTAGSTAALAGNAAATNPAAGPPAPKQKRQQGANGR